MAKKPLRFIDGEMSIDENSSMVVVDAGAQTWYVYYEYDGSRSEVRGGGFHSQRDAEIFAEKWIRGDKWAIDMAGGYAPPRKFQTA